MARARNIKPGFFKNELLGTADPYVSLLFAGLWTLADKAGILEDRPLRIKAELFPYRESFDVNGYLTVLCTLGFIHRYEVGGISLIQIDNFKKHQNPHHTERESEYPEYSICCQDSVKQPLNNGDTPADSLFIDSLIPDSLEAGKGKSKKLKSIEKFDPLSISLPEGTSEAKWQEWICYRRVRKFTTNEFTIKKQLSLLANFGDRANDIIDRSIQNGWQGLFPFNNGMPDSKGSTKSNLSKQSLREDYLKQQGYGGSDDAARNDIIDGTAFRIS